MDCQDWETVTIRSKKTVHNDAKPVRQTSDSAQVRKLMDNDIIKVKQLSKESRQELVQRRLLGKLTQVQLNQQCLFPINTINKIESGQLSPTVSQLNTLNRVLKTGLKYES